MGAGGPPAWIIGGGIVACIGLDLIADHIEKEQMELEDAFNYDQQRLDLLHPLNERTNSSLVTALHTYQKDIVAGIKIDFLNTQINEKNMSVKTELINKNGFVCNPGIWQEQSYKIKSGDSERGGSCVFVADPETL